MRYENLEKKISELPPDLAQEVEDFVDFLSNKRAEVTSSGKKGFTFQWAGALVDLKQQYTSVELQKKALEWW